MTIVRGVAAAVAMAVAMPAAAGSQVYPERLLSKAKAAAAYQRRDRDDNSSEQTERTSKVLHVGSDGTVDLGNIAGDITVTRGGGSEATLEIVKTARGRSTDDAKELLGLVSVDVNERANRAEIRSRYPQGDDMRRGNRRNVNVSVAYTLTAPSGTRIVVESISGNIKISDIKGEINASTISGDIRVLSPARTGTLKTISGTVEVSDANVDALQSSSVSGDVILRHVVAHRIDAGSISGNVRIEDAQCERVAGHSTSGNLSYGGTLAKNGRYELKSFSGEVRVAVPAGSGFEVDANSFSGDVRSDLPITTHGNADERHGRRRILSGTYGDGSAVLDLTTFSGSIVITKR